MMEFMVHGTFRQQDQQAIVERIPQEQQRIRELRQQGTVQALYIAADSSGVWLVMQAETHEQVQQALESLPLHPYMQLAISPLSRM